MLLFAKRTVYDLLLCMEAAFRFLKSSFARFLSLCAWVLFNAEKPIITLREITNRTMR